MLDVFHISAMHRVYGFNLFSLVSQKPQGCDRKRGWLVVVFNHISHVAFQVCSRQARTTLSMNVVSALTLLLCRHP